MGHPLTLGTAGHIDHGKTALVRALTGVETDRLPEERERGISIELGYAPLALPSGRRLSVVDVPGHERFVRTMVAGATGIDLFLLVVAADDGVMPQTREHAAVLAGLGLREGVVAITKADVADPAPRSPRCARSCSGRTARSRWSRARPAPATGSATSRPRWTASPPGCRAGVRTTATPVLHVDRSFTIRGAGTVVTGTLWSGSLGRGDRVAILPAGLEARVRGVQVHDEPVDRAGAGQRVAVNLTGVEVRAVGRGDVLAAADAGSRRPTWSTRRCGSAAPSTASASRSTTARARRRPGSRRSAAGSGSCASSSRSSPGRATGSSCARSPRRTRWAVGWCSIRPRGGTGRGGTCWRGCARLREGSGRRAGGDCPPTSGTTAHAGVRPRSEGDRPPVGEALALEERLRAAGHEPPTEAELGRDAVHLPALREPGRAVRIGRDLHAHPEALAQVEERGARRSSEAEGAITLARLRDELGTSRKFAQALLEHLDAARVTLRRPDDSRVLRRRRS